MARSKLQGCVYRPSVKRNGKKTKSRYYWAKYYGPDAPKRHVLLMPDGRRITDKDVASARLRDLLRDHDRRAAGLIDPQVESAHKPLWRILLAALRDLRRRGRSRGHVKQVRGYAIRVFRDCGMKNLADLNVANVQRGLDLLDDGTRGRKTLRAYRSACVAVGSYASAPHVHLLSVNPLVRVPMPDGDTVRERRAATADEARALLKAAPMPRRLFYHFCMLTGYRFCETRRVKWGHIDLGERPFVQLPMTQTKGGKLSKRKRRERWDVEIPLHPELVSALSEYKPADGLTIMGDTGLEPVTSWMSTMRSSQLS
jgi:integrase